MTEEMDQRVLLALLSDFLSPKVLHEDYSYGEGDHGALYRFPAGDRPLEHYLETIDQMSNEEVPQIFGLHPNADITKNISDAR